MIGKESCTFFSDLLIALTSFDEVCKHIAMRCDQFFVRSLLAFELVISQGHAAESFRKLKDSEIKTRLAGMEATDGVHWAEQYMRDGTFKVFDMGRLTRGKWFVRKGQLCLDNGKPDPEAPFGCKDVWLSGNKLEFRVPGLPAFEGVLQKQQPR